MMDEAGYVSSRDTKFLGLLVFCVLQMKKDFLYQRQHDDVRRMLEKQVCTLQSPGGGGWGVDSHIKREGCSSEILN